MFSPNLHPLCTAFFFCCNPQALYLALLTSLKAHPGLYLQLTSKHQLLVHSQHSSFLFYSDPFVEEKLPLKKISNFSCLLQIYCSLPMYITPDSDSLPLFCCYFLLAYSKLLSSTGLCLQLCTCSFSYHILRCKVRSLLFFLSTSQL